MRNLAKGLAATACLLLIAARLGFGQPQPPSYRHDAEDGVLRWRPSKSDSASDVVVGRFQHLSSDQTSHSGRFSERVSFTAGNGTKFLLTHRVGRARVLEELRVTVWVNANRPGVQIIGHVLLPEVLDPKTARPVVIPLRGDSYDTPGQWQRLTLHEPLLLLERQKRILNRNQGRNISLRGAYLHEVAVNAYTGPGATQIFLDDLEVTPFLGKKPREPIAPALERGLPLAETSAEVRQGRLFVNERPARLRAVLYRGESLERLEAAGFNAIWFGDPVDPKLLDRAHDAGLWVIAPPPALDSATSFDEPPWDSVLLWQMGNDLRLENRDQLNELVARLRQHDSHGRPMTGSVTSGLLPYSRMLDVVSVGHGAPVGSFSPRAYRDWLLERARLTRAGTPLWAWIPTEPAVSLPLRTAYTTGEPITAFRAVAEPEQLRLFAYAALAAGVRGLGFWSQDSLEADGPEERERLLALRLLNLELRLIDELLQGATPLDTITGNGGDVEASLFRTPRGPSVLLASWFGEDSQYVPDQAAGNSVSLIVPGLPESTALWRVSLAGIEQLRRSRVAGGVPVTLKEFDVASVVLFSNGSQLQAIRSVINASRQQAAQLALELAKLKRQRVERIDRELTALGRPAPSASTLIQRSHEFYASGWRDYQSQRYGSAFQNAERAMRPLRILQRAHWKAAVKSLPNPLTSPYATSFSTLPEHWRFIERLNRGRFGPNLMAEADFENAPVMAGRGWAYARRTIEGVEVKMELTPQEAHRGSYCLRLEADPIDPERAPAIPETAPVRVTSASVPVLPGQVVRIAGWVRIPRPITGSIAGATLTDSLGAKPLALHWRETQGWQEFVAYRPVERSGEISLDFALTGFGQVNFDDVSVQVLDDTDLMTRSPSSKTRKRLDLRPTSRRLNPR